MAELEAEQTSSTASKAKVFGVWSLAIFTFSFLANVNTTPELAKFGLGSILLFVFAIAFFLGPTAMASAEMGAGWPRTGGIYVWTKLAFGEGPGFMVIWIEWANFVVAWPGIMGTITLQAAFVFEPRLANNAVFLTIMVIIVTWVAAAFALRGLEVAKNITWFAVIAGVVLPTLILVGFAIAWLVQGKASQMEISTDALLPDLGFHNIAFISGALLMFMGIEISAIHAQDVRRPEVTIPRANGIAVAMCLLLFVPLTLALAVVIPSKDIDIVVGLVQGAKTIFTSFDLEWLTPVFSVMLVLGLAAAMVQIIGGPSRGLLIAARQGGNLPPALQKENKNRMPVAIILLQAIVSSVLALGYNFLGSVQNAWFMFMLIQTNMSLVLYLLLFASVIKLRYSKPNVPRPYKIPGKKVGLYAIAGVGMLVCVVGILISFFPTTEAKGFPVWAYVLVLLAGTAIFLAAPFVFWIFRKPSWVNPAPDELAPEDVDKLADVAPSAGGSA